MEIKRGHCYYMSLNDAVGSEQKIGRPVVVVSSDEGNETSPTVTIVYLTSSPRNISVCPYITSVSRRKSWVLCNQPTSVDKSRLGDYMGKLFPEEMARIDKALLTSLGLNTEEPEEDGKVAELEDEIERLKVEVDVHKRLYDKAVGMIVEKRIAADTAPESPKPKVAKEEPKVEVAEILVESSDKIDINTCRMDDLRRLGVAYNIAAAIIDMRPFKRVEDLLTVPKLTEITYGLIKDRVVVGGKVNMNTATVEEMMSRLHLGKVTAEYIAKHRKRVGGYKDVSDLLLCPRVTEQMFNKIQNYIEV